MVVELCDVSDLGTLLHCGTHTQQHRQCNAIQLPLSQCHRVKAALYAHASTAAPLPAQNVSKYTGYMQMLWSGDAERMGPSIVEAGSDRERTGAEYVKYLLPNPYTFCAVVFEENSTSQKPCSHSAPQRLKCRLFNSTLTSTIRLKGRPYDNRRRTMPPNFPSRV